MAAMRNQRIAAVLMLLIGAALLIAGLSGVADDWMAGNVHCGGVHDHHECASGEANGVLNLVGGIFVGVGVLLFVLSYLLAGRLTDPLTTSVDPASIPVWNAPGRARRPGLACRQPRPAGRVARPRRDHRGRVPGLEGEAARLTSGCAHAHTRNRRARPVVSPIMKWFRLMAFSFLALGGALLFVGFGGLGENWVSENFSCGANGHSYACSPGEGETAAKIVGGIFFAIGLIELVLSFILMRIGTVVDEFGSAIDEPAIGVWTPGAAGAPMAPAASAPATHGTLAERLARLAALRDRGVLTDAEFETQKARLLQ
jgi:hypothetical protein